MTRDLLVIALLTAGSCLAVGAVGALLLHQLRRTRLRNQLLAATLLPVLAVAVAVVVNVRFMFLSTHDSGVVMLALGLSVVLAGVGGYFLARRVNAGFRRLTVEVADLVADATPDSGAAPKPDAREVPALPAELAEALSDVDQARQALAEARARERAAEASRRELVTFLSHDLRTPLAGLRALIEALEDGVISDVPRALGHLRATSTRMASLVDDLFALSRVQGSGVAKSRVQLSLAEVIADVTSEARPTAAAAAVELEVDLPADDRLAVFGNSADLSRAFANLVGNAIRHTEAGSRVRVRAGRAADGSVEVAVRDQCGGIPEDHLSRVFDTGWRGSPGRAAEDGGAGLGLAIARGVVQSHAGMIGVRNVGDGCCFDVELPAPAAR